jgi:hypothetical protein
MNMKGFPLRTTLAVLLTALAISACVSKRPAIRDDSYFAADIPRNKLIHQRVHFSIAYAKGYSIYPAQFAYAGGGSDDYRFAFSGFPLKGELAGEFSMHIGGGSASTLHTNFGRNTSSAFYLLMLKGGAKYNVGFRNDSIGPTYTYMHVSLGGPMWVNDETKISASFPAQTNAYVGGAAGLSFGLESFFFYPDFSFFFDNMLLYGFFIPTEGSLATSSKSGLYTTISLGVRAYVF